MMFLSLSTPSFAWEYQEGEDPLVDIKFGLISAQNGNTGLAFKCWGGAAKITMMIISTGQAFDDSANYKSSIPILVRADKEKIIHLEVVPQSSSGDLVFITSSSTGSDLSVVLDAISAAKNRVVVGFSDYVYSLPAKGSRKAVEALRARCELP